jgi:DNA-binding NarL/FixJ family response regulator
MTRVLVAAPTPLLRAGLHTLLATPELQVVGEASTPEQLANALSGVDVIVVSGALWEAAARLLGASAGRPGPALIVLSDDERLVGTLRGLPLRSWGLVPPDASAAALQAAVTAAAQGLIVLAQPLGDRLLGGRVAVTALPADEGDEPLTSREHEVLDLLGQGLSNKQIARRLAISEHTVKFHVSALYAKLGATSRTDAVSRGARRGLITL